jgi:hypothetical protein
MIVLPENENLTEEIESVKEYLLQNKCIKVDKKNHLQRSHSPKKLEEAYNYFKESVSSELKERFPSFEDFLCCYNNNLPEVPKCPFCGKKAMFFANGIASYAMTCGLKPCKDLQKVKSNKEHHGGKHSSANPEIMAQIQKTKQRKFEEGIYDGKGNYRKGRQAYLERTGYAYPMLNPEVKNKVKETNLRNHGGKWAISCPEVQEKSRTTLLAKTGYAYASQNPETQKKIRESSFAHYGVDWVSKAPEVRKKCEETCLKRYGCINPASQVPEIHKRALEACKKTWALHYREGHPFRDEEILRKSRSKYTYKGITFDSSYELAVYISYERKGIVLERTPTTDIHYIDDAGNPHKYVPDFRDPRDGHFIEVKDSHWMRGENYKELIFKEAEVIWDKDKSIDKYLKEMRDLYGTSKWHLQFKNALHSSSGFEKEKTE